MHTTRCVLHYTFYGRPHIYSAINSICRVPFYIDVSNLVREPPLFAYYLKLSALDWMSKPRACWGPIEAPFPEFIRLTFLCQFLPPPMGPIDAPSGWLPESAAQESRLHTEPTMQPAASLVLFPSVIE